MPVCDHPSADGSPCSRPIPEGSDHCFIHSDGGVPESHGAPEANDNAVGNPGGSAPEGNANAQRHSLHADRKLFYERLPEEKQNTVDQLEAALIERYREYQGRDPDRADVVDIFEIAVGYIQRDYAREHMAREMEGTGNPLLKHIQSEENGEINEHTVMNGIIDKISDIQRKDRLSRRDKGLEQDPDSGGSGGPSEVVDAWQSIDNSAD